MGSGLAAAGLTASEAQAKLLSVLENPQRKVVSQPSFDALFAETQEDQELRMKLLAGQSTRAQ